LILSADFKKRLSVLKTVLGESKTLNAKLWEAAGSPIVYSREETIASKLPTVRTQAHQVVVTSA
jgi:hypothetical protein